MAGAKGTKGGEAQEKAAPEVVKSPELLSYEAIRDAVGMINRSITSGEERFMHRVLRGFGRVRRGLSAASLGNALALGFKEGEPALVMIKDAVGDVAAMEIESEDSAGEDTAVAAKADGPHPEIKVYLQLLATAFLIDTDRAAMAAELSGMTVDLVSSTRRRISNELAAKAFFLFSWAHELVGKSASIREMLFAALRTTTLRSDEPGQTVLLNQLLRNFLEHNLIDQAQKLASKTALPESASNSEAARYLFYLGRIEAIQLEYSSAYANLELAIRKAPKGAVGFLQAANKLAVIVKMLLGEIPTRETFNGEGVRRSLKPYLALTQAVRVGDLARFSAVVQQFRPTFEQDKNYTLILRLRHNVIKTGVRMISVSYSRISLADVAAKLQLDGPEEAEYIVAKAIRDEVIDASIVHEEGYVRSNDMLDVYGTTQPHDAFHARINFCLNLHNESVRAMRYAPNAYRKYLEKSDDDRERELAEAEIAEMEEEDGDF
mmetsp:Transcript_4996/g.12935  ORF Transcript_4996/g.12935 Transcript_4996/m.12935 type:complete len:491 (+) Transcript_4996:44-1516(+)